MKTRKIIKRILLLCLAAALLLCVSGCKEGKSGEATKLSFQAASGYDYLKTLNGTQVTISGYMATSSPVDGSFLFLMNLPYQSCPFCVPNTSQLSNTVEVYPQKGESFGFTNQAIQVTGTLEVAPSEDRPFTDLYGYEFNYKIVDASYTIIRADELSEDMALWQKIAETDVVNDIYRMYDYVNFLCAWNTYFVNPGTDENGNVTGGYYLYPEDAIYLVTIDGAQYHYGFREGYFDDIVAKIEAADPEAFADLVANVRGAEALAQKAWAELQNGRYSSEKQYLEQFGTEDLVYTLDAGDELVAQMETLYYEFANWLGSWEM